MHKFKVGYMRHKRKKTILGAVIKWTAITAGSVALFTVVREAAFRERGYSALGGEALLLLIPIIYYAIEQMVKDWIIDSKALYREREKGYL